jgi:ADP-ribose pyrophosphatase YjhB (NUDIX family)
MENEIPVFGTSEAGVKYHSRPGGYAVLVRDDEVGVVVTPRGVFLPGGGCESLESSRESAVRETREECGLEITILDEIGTADELVLAAGGCPHYRKHCTFFTAVVTGESTGSEADHEFRWMPIEAAVPLFTHESQRWAVQKVLANSG